jgi:hypothetical protein
MRDAASHEASTRKRAGDCEQAVPSQCGQRRRQHRASLLSLPTGIASLQGPTSPRQSTLPCDLEIGAAFLAGRRPRSNLWSARAGHSPGRYRRARSSPQSVAYAGLCTNGQPERRKRHRVRRCSRRAIRIGLSVASCGFATLMPRQYSNACLAIAAMSSVDLTFGSVQSPRWL